MVTSIAQLSEASSLAKMIVGQRAVRLTCKLEPYH